MLRQALTISSRALRSTTRSVAQKPLSRPQTFITPIAVRRIQPSAARWYSDAPKETPAEEKKEQNAETKPEGEAKENADSTEDAALTECKKKLEAKDKEAADWRVCLRDFMTH